MMSDEAFIHIVRVDIDPDHEAAFNAWYDETHFPELLACPGWIEARRFVAIDDGPKYAAMYKVAGKWAFATPQFLKVKGFGPFEAFITNFTRIQLKPFSGSRSLNLP